MPVLPSQNCVLPRASPLTIEESLKGGGVRISKHGRPGKHAVGLKVSYLRTETAHNTALLRFDFETAIFEVLLPVSVSKILMHPSDPPVTSSLSPFPQDKHKILPIILLHFRARKRFSINKKN